MKTTGFYTAQSSQVSTAAECLADILSQCPDVRAFAAFYYHFNSEVFMIGVA